MGAETGGEKVNKNLIRTVIGTAGAFLAGLFGGMDGSIITLLIFMGINYASGLICAVVFHRSSKSKSGRAESKASFKGLIRKGMVLLLVMIGARLDLIIGASYIRDGICIAFIVNEMISITENAALMGVPMPDILLNAIETVKDKNKH